MKISPNLIMGWTAPLLFLKKDDIGIKKPTKVYMPLTKETKPYFLKNNWNNIYIYIYKLNRESGLSDYSFA